jgi:hypothetical protein
MPTKKKFDEYLMLLSADWFLPHWERLSLIFDPKQKAQIQLAAQDTVREFMQGADIYWNTSFEEARLQRTQVGFVERLKKGGIQVAGIDRLLAVLDEAGKVGDREVETTIWLFGMISEMWEQGDAGVSSASLDAQVAQILKGELETRRDQAAQIDFEPIALSSKTPWDMELRGLTPDLPTFVSDFANVHFQVGDEFKLLWCGMASKLNPEQRKSLLDWYVTESRKLADPGFEYRLPRWMAT